MVRVRARIEELQLVRYRGGLVTAVVCSLAMTRSSQTSLTAGFSKSQLHQRL